MPKELNLHIASIADIPMFNPDECQKGFPPPVVKFRSEVAQADGVLIASPEYNFSITGVLKNAIDWASRKPDMPFAEKPVAIFSVTTGVLGGARVQYDLRRILAQLDTLLLVRPEIFIGSAKSKFDASGELTDECTRQFLTDQMVAFHRWILRCKGAVEI
jgi:chromate reductase